MSITFNRAGLSGLIGTVAGGLVLLIIEKTAPFEGKWLAFMFVITVLAVGTIAFAIAPKTGPKLTRKQRRLIKEQKEQGDYRAKLIKSLALLYLIENPDRLGKGSPGDLPPADWLNQKLAERDDTFRVRVEGKYWSELR